MKIPFLFVLICFLSFSCNNNKGDSHSTIKDTVKADTSTKIKAEKSINSYSPVDISPMDISYYPADYPKLKMEKTKTLPLARVIYSRPHLQGRQLFHDVLKYGEPWRLGANEATEFELYSDAIIQNKKIKSGRYILYTIPEQDKWTIVLNSNIDSWGLHPDATKDVARFIVPAALTNNSIEYFTMIFQQTDAGANLLMAWDNVEVILPISF
jgi:hypothetical protein